MDMATGMVTAMATGMAMTSDNRTKSVMPKQSPLIVPHLRILTSLTLLICSGSALAGDWKLSDSITTELTAVDRSDNDASSGLVAQITPRISLRGEGGRARANIDYGVTASIGSSDTDPEAITHDLAAEGELEAIKNFFFLGARASATLVGNSATSGNVDSINVNSDGRQSYSLALLPNFRHRLNRYATIVSNNEIDYVDTTGGSGGSDEGSTGVTLNLGIQSGPVFGPLGWSLNATRSKTDFDDREDETTTANAGLNYRINGQWSANSSIGYEDNEVQTDRDNTDGVTWRVGTAWTPNPRTQASFNYGERFIGSIYSGSFTHRTRKTNISLNLSRDVTNRRSFRESDPFRIGTRINIITGEQTPIFTTRLEETDENFVNTEARATIAITGRRTTVTLFGNIANRNFEVRDIDEDSYSLGLNVTRQLGGGYQASLGANYDQANDTSSGDSDTYDARLSLSKQLSKRTSASVEVFRRERNASASGDDFSENRVAVSLTSSFL